MNTAPPPPPVSFSGKTTHLRPSIVCDVICCANLKHTVLSSSCALPRLIRAVRLLQAASPCPFSSRFELNYCMFYVRVMADWNNGYSGGGEVVFDEKTKHRITLVEVISKGKQACGKAAQVGISGVDKCKVEAFTRIHSFAKLKKQKWYDDIRRVAVTILASGMYYKETVGRFEARKRYSVFFYSASGR